MQLKVKVLRVIAEAQGIAAFELGALDGAPLPPFEAGCHIDVLTRAGQVRQYSLCNAPAETHRYVIAVLDEPFGRGGSRSMHASVRAGDVLQISAPKNHFALLEDAPRSLLFAAGIGITPLIAMAERLHALGRDFVLHYAARCAERAAFTRRLDASGFADKVRCHHSGGDALRRLDVTAALGAPDPGTHVYVCGPNGFLGAVRAAASAAGWPDDQIHFECFAGQQAHAPGDRAFDVLVRSSGQLIRVQASQTVTEALEAHGVALPISCGQGVCGTCLTGVLEGEIDHRDLFLTPEEQRAQDQFLPCCSRARSARLVLAL